ncbi:MAG: fibro-slime domain-containing protein [Fibrobacteres bacterium]|nr:fibro-slime domain-containing protein [Fibrobacterota bacterium]
MHRAFERIGITQLLKAVALIGLFSVPASAQKTLMIMVDYFGQRTQTDTIINLQVFQPTAEIKYKGGNPPSPVLTNAYDTEKLGWWYALPNFNPDDYAMGRVRFNTRYSRGWYQNDSTYRASAGDTLFFPDTQKTFTYQPQGGNQLTVTLPLIAPKFFVFPSASTYRGPKLYQAAGNSETQLLNMRATVTVGTKSVVQPGALDKCLESVPGDTVWIRWGTPTNPPGQSPMEADMQCFGYNPFSTRFGIVNIRNPWPGADLPVVEFNGQNIPMYPNATNPDWLTADLRFIAVNGTPSGVIRFKKGAGSSNYFDSAGIDQGVVMPFTITSGGANWYFIPSEAGVGIISGKGALPKPTHTIFVQNPWKPGSPRLMWQEDNNLHVMRPTQSCGWYSYPLFGAPKSILIGHSFEDSTYGATGVQFRQRANWVTIPASAITAKNETWIQTMNAANARVPAVATGSPVLKDCSYDTLKLVMEAFDFKGRGETGGNPSFQVGGATEGKGEASSGLVKGMVLSTLDTNGLPIYSGKDSGDWQSGGINNKGPALALPLAQNLWKKSTPSNWFDTTALRAAVPGIAIGHTCLELPLAKGGPKDSGYYKFADTSFFPLDTISDRRGYSPLLATDNQQHNFLFCLHGHAAFEYTPGLKFEFRGDDDVWVFINNKLAVDLGGSHAPESTFVNLDKLRLREGSVYPFDIFYCERQRSGSSILIRTTMDLQPSWKYKAQVARSGTGLKIDILGNQKNNFVPSCADLMKPQAESWVTTNGRMVVVGPENSGLNDIHTSDVSLYGGNLTYSGGSIILDTNKLKDDPALSWPGTYQIRIESRLGDSLYTVKFTKAFGVVVVDGTVLDGDGDGVADSVLLVAPAPLFKDSPAYTLVWFNAMGVRDSVKPAATSGRLISDSIIVMPLAGKNWGRRTTLPAGIKPDSLGWVNTRPNGGTKVVSNPIKLRDGMGPFADSARILFSSVAGAPDTLRIWVNEPSLVNGAALPGDFYSMLGNRIAPRGLVSALVPTMVDARTFEFLLPGTHGISPADSLRLAGRIADILGNSAAKSSVWVPIRSNAQGTAAIRDVNGDGMADLISVNVRGSLVGVKYAKIVWAGLTKTWELAIVANGSFTLPAPAGDAFPKGLTACLAGGCTVQFQDAAKQPLQTWALMDSVPPVVLYGSYRFGVTEDQLQVKFSEPVTLSALPQDQAKPWIEVGPLAGRRAIAHSAAALVGNDSAVLTVPIVLGLAGGEDSASLVVGSAAGALLDALGNKVGSHSAWGPIRFGVPPLLAAMSDPNGVGTATHVKLTAGRSVPAAALLAVSSVALSWGSASDARTIPVSALTGAPGVWTGTFPVPFPFGATSCPGCQGIVSGVDGSSNVILELDSVPPVIVKGKVRYTGTAGHPDTLIISLSEPWNSAAPNTALQQAIAHVGRTGRDLPVAPMLGWMKLSPTEFALFVDSSLTATWLLGDSVRLAPAPNGPVNDEFKNFPGLVTPWAPLEFGLRPPLVEFTVIHPILTHNPAVDVGSLAGKPRLSLLVVDQSGKNLYVVDDYLQKSTKGFIEGGNPPVHDSASVIMIRAKLNRPIQSGTLLIYDNLGISVLRQDIGDLSKLWDPESKDQMREIFMQWDGRGQEKAFVATGVYLIRLVAKVDNGAGGSDLVNHLWKVGFKNAPK